MDYFQQGRSQGSTAQSNQHVYAYQTPTSGTSNSAQLYYQQQAAQQSQQMGHQTHSQQPSYQQHYTMQAGSANASLDYNSQHNQSGMAGHHNQSGNGRGSGGRSGPRGVAGVGGAHAHGGAGDAIGQAARYAAPAPTLQDLPLRMVIDSKHVGAIIGTGGNNIREITKESKARVVVDVQRSVKDQHGHSEKIISIVGPLENCSKACVKILEVVQREHDKDENKDSEVELKIRAHNQLVGRLIGKQGVTIKKIMQETGTTIFVSNSNDSGSRSGELGPFPDMIMQMERTITVKGPSIDKISAAEQKISSKLRQSYETDVQNRLSMNALPGALPGGMINPSLDAAYSLMNMRPVPPMLGTQNTKVTKMYVPNSMVGAIIGAKGTHIRNIMRNSGANIRIEGGDKKERSADEDEKKEVGAGDAPPPPAAHVEVGQGDGTHADEKKEDERLVTITGSDVQQYRAQFWIFQRVSEQSQHFLEEVKLRTELAVPSRLVGRIIGKGGQNVRELQRITGASVKIPEDEAKGEASGDEGKEASGDAVEPAGSSGEGTMVRIVGNFQATQAVQLRIGQLIQEFNRSSLQDRRRGDGDNHDSSRKQTPPSNGERNE